MVTADDAIVREIQPNGLRDVKASAGCLRERPNVDLGFFRAVVAGDNAGHHTGVEPMRRALVGNERFQQVVGTRVNDAYGEQVDELIMDGARTDISFTVFLSRPETYDGGELIIASPSGEAPSSCRQEASSFTRRRRSTELRR